MREFDKLSSLLPAEVKDPLLRVSEDTKRSVMEIRLIKNSSLSLTLPRGRIFINRNGDAVPFSEGLAVGENIISETALRITDYSYYAYEKDIANGFITLKGGHRVGLSGKGSEVSGKTLLKEITSFNFRIAKSVDGAAKDIIPIIKGQTVKNTLILSPPCGGKTTVLRDVAKSLSAEGYGISIVDCRGELSMGNTVFFGCDILDGFPKRDGILHSLKFLSPEIIICDEITSLAEVEDIKAGMNSGVVFIVTAHASDIKDSKKRPVTAALTEIFDTVILLEGKNSPGKIKEVISVA